MPTLLAVEKLTGSPKEWELNPVSDPTKRPVMMSGTPLYGSVDDEEALKASDVSPSS